MPTAHTVRLYRAQLSSADESEHCGRGAFAVRHLSEMRLLITATGDLDATNARALGRFVERHTGVSKQLVLDLSDVEFFGSEGFAALHYVSVHCARHDVDWLFIGGRTMRRIVAICDPDAELPLADGLAAALARLDHLGRCRHPVQSASRRPPQSDHAIPAPGRPVATATA
jgi:anti-anti-sigma factor